MHHRSTPPPSVPRRVLRPLARTLLRRPVWVPLAVLAVLGGVLLGVPPVKDSAGALLEDASANSAHQAPGRSWTDQGRRGAADRAARSAPSGTPAPSTTAEPSPAAPTPAPSTTAPEIGRAHV